MRKVWVALLLIAAPLFADTRTVFTRAAFDAAFVNVSGDTMTGLLTVGATTGVAFPGSTSGTATVKAPAVAGTAAVTLPNASSTLPIFGQQMTFTGPTAARTWAIPDSNVTITNPATRTFAAGDFTASGTMTWDVDSGDVLTHEWSQTNKNLFWAIDAVTTDVGGVAGTGLRIALPNSLVAKVRQYFFFQYVDAGAAAATGECRTTAGGTFIECFKAGTTNWTITSSDNTTVRFTAGPIFLQ